MFNQILIVCTGNICRSPMAEGLLSNALQPINKHATYVASAGLKALVGCAADKLARRVMQRHGIDISRHRGRQLNSDLVNWADLILVMEGEQKAAIEVDYLSSRGKVFCLGKWHGFSVPDPYCQSNDVFEWVFDLIAKGVTDWVTKIGEETINEQ